ncbi:NAD(P)/FAD-dependent oxidoreductase [Aquibacillus rhizosphaerae]|uniref:FAD-binding oxidoreductase n=1 Tax=Aquibacillus rhizosphaerae TaxID=3051431 RepID=A0ABT7L5M3_9BACI|nr:FAD-binding oxidoreductase [Aquibacillus sp. LR5S19]MDL4841172.1 FAD-binding oxidoreductase [Aquibacillus sp. LR5S19]
MAKFIIIGAGILGASTAYHLTKSGAEVIIIDRKDPGQATDAAAGIICPWLSQRRNQAWYQLAKSGAAYYPKLIQALEADGETETGYKQVGAISIRKEEKKLISMEERAYKRREQAPEIGEITRLHSSEVKTLFPPLSDDFRGLHISGAARVDGRLMQNALTQAAIKNGATFIEGDAEIKYSGIQVSGVIINGKAMNADTVIVTAGVWAKSLLKPLGVNFSVEPQKAQIAHLGLPNTDTSNWPVVMPPSDHYLLAFEDRIIAGATHENNVDLDDYNVTSIGLKEIFDKVLTIAPELSEGTLIETRVGFRPVTPGFLPVIGPLPDHKGILIANGLGSSGLTTGPYIGSELAKLALGEPVDIDINLYPVSGALE